MVNDILFQADDGKQLVLTREDLVGVIERAVRSEIANYQHSCRFSLSKEDTEQVEGYIKGVTELGDGELAKGMQVIRQNHQWLKETREKSNKIVNSFVLTITGAVALALVYTIWEGIRKKLGN